jgi:hypothetical protein
MVETFIIKPDKLEEFTTGFKIFETWMKERPELYTEVKSHKLFSHMLGGKWGGYVEMWEFENLANFEKWVNKLMQSDFMTTIYPQFAILEVPGTDSIEIWNSVP